MSNNPIKSQIQGHSSGSDTVWGVTLTHDDGRTAFANGFASSADARRAEEFLRLGFATGWNVMPKGALMAPGLDALKLWRESAPADEFVDWDLQLVSSIWRAMINDWMRQMFVRIERGEEPDESK